jgi:hypothetical protein
MRLREIRHIGKRKKACFCFWMICSNVFFISLIRGPDANSFRPQRWIEHYEKSSQDPSAFNLFGAGSRACPGEKIAYFDVRLFVGT